MESMVNEIMEHEAIEHWPFAHEAVQYGKIAREFERYAKGVRKWQRFFRDLAQDRQEKYQEARRAYLKQEAKSNGKEIKQLDLSIKTKQEKRKLAEFNALMRKALGEDYKDVTWKEI